MSSLFNYRFAFLLCLMVIMITNVMAVMSRRARESTDFSNMNNVEEAVKYLQDLDSYYSTVSRPRYGKRASMFQQFTKRTSADNQNPTHDDIRYVIGNSDKRYLPTFYNVGSN